jgi:hypothetical protein
MMSQVEKKRSSVALNYWSQDVELLRARVAAPGVVPFATYASTETVARHAAAREYDVIPLTPRSAAAASVSRDEIVAVDALDDSSTYGPMIVEEPATRTSTTPPPPSGSPPPLPAEAEWNGSQWFFCWISFQLLLLNG